MSSSHEDAKYTFSYDVNIDLAFKESDATQNQIQFERKTKLCTVQTDNWFKNINWIKITEMTSAIF